MAGLFSGSSLFGGDQQPPDISDAQTHASRAETDLSRTRVLAYQRQLRDAKAFASQNATHSFGLDLQQPTLHKFFSNG